MKLIESLRTFEGANNEADLQVVFTNLSQNFLYGGYLSVKDTTGNEHFRVYIKTVEFYYHSERPDGVKDYIVYHRNGNGLEHLPYLPLMSINAHSSGFDITFENEVEQYRASALIREYEVKKGGKYLKWEKNEKHGKYMFVEKDEYCFNNQVLSLYFILSGFGICGDNNVTWIDDERNMTKQIESHSRNNVPKFDSNGKKTHCQDDRKWGFTRKDEPEINKQ
ncbi:MAG: hypothetical protein MJZ86_04780 [Bacteroidales bacterium]|nr:hypothetical protein [Bacteroidales bacterium]